LIYRTRFPPPLPPNFSCNLFILTLSFETGSCYVAQAGLELLCVCVCVWYWCLNPGKALAKQVIYHLSHALSLALNCCSFCLSLPSSGISGVGHHVQIAICFLKNLGYLYC
jgi:hypothetical protein